MPNYTKHGKILEPLTDKDFREGMENGHFVKDEHRAFCILLYYSAVRKAEALRVTPKSFLIDKKYIWFDVGQRLKHSKKTDPINIPLKAPYVDELLDAIEDTNQEKRVFPYSAKTGYNIVARAFRYPHLFRLSRITNFFMEGWDLVTIKSWTGLTVAALEYYVGRAKVSKMGEALK